VEFAHGFSKVLSSSHLKQREEGLGKVARPALVFALVIGACNTGSASAIHQV